MRKRRTENLTTVHEANYAKLRRVVPQLNLVEEDAQYYMETQGQRILLNVLEQTNYTTVVGIEISHATFSQYLSVLNMTVRCYHDAQVAEILNFQRHRNLRPSYGYPNAFMYHINEKQQINHFLGDWLDHCLNCRWVFDDRLLALDA